MVRTVALKFLIADDHTAMRQTLRALLAPFASAIGEATNGSEAVGLYTEQQPDWVIMDIQMKPVGGLAATRAIRARFPAARVIIVTQYDDVGLRAEAADAGACAYFLKDDLSALTQLLSAETGSRPSDPGDAAVDHSTGNSKHETI
jgi:two-component system response regulator DegU